MLERVTTACNIFYVHEFVQDDTCLHNPVCANLVLLDVPEVQTDFECFNEKLLIVAVCRACSLVLPTVMCTANMSLSKLMSVCLHHFIKLHKL